MERITLESDKVNLDDHIIPVGHAARICLYRQGSRCCKYIVFFDINKEFCCVKTIPRLKEQIDSEAHKMKAKGNNCEGFPGAKK